MQWEFDQYCGCYYGTLGIVQEKEIHATVCENDEYGGVVDWRILRQGSTRRLAEGSIPLPQENPEPILDLAKSLVESTWAVLEKLL